MSAPNRPDDRTKTEQILDLLLDALLERQTARRRASEAARTPAAGAAAPPQGQPRDVAAPPPPAPGAPAQATCAPQRVGNPSVPDSRRGALVRPQPARQPLPDEPGWNPAEPVKSIGFHRIVWRLLLFVLAAALLINVPLTRHGVSLARMMPDSAALVIRDGLVLKGPGPEIYQQQDE